MTTDELRVNLMHLINAYVTDTPTKGRLLALVALDDVPAKGILVELVPYLDSKASAADAEIVKDIAFYFC